MSKFYVGQKVVCIDADGEYPLGTDILVKNKVYEVSAITCNGLGCHLVGMNTGIRSNGYYQTRFVPVEPSNKSVEFAEDVLKWIEEQVEELEPEYV